MEKSKTSEKSVSFSHLRLAAKCCASASGFSSIPKNETAIFVGVVIIYNKNDILFVGTDKCQ
jgi:hypothetical protein